MYSRFTCYATLLTAALSLVFIMGCGNKETPETQEATVRTERIAPPKFNRDTMWRRGERAFFSDSAAKELRLLRNEIFALHGRPFSSPDLQQHFAALPWYRLDSAFHDSLLSEEERELVKDITEAERILSVLPPEMHSTYKKETTFRSRPDFDTVLVDTIELTGDTTAELRYSRIAKTTDSIAVYTTVISGTDTLFYDRREAWLSPSISTFTQLSTIYTLVIEMLSTRASTSVEMFDPALAVELMRDDIRRVAPKQVPSEKTLQSYIQSFRAKLLALPLDESGGCNYIWYAPLQRFITYYCP
jgi:hypothetical protein